MVSEGREFQRSLVNGLLLTSRKEIKNRIKAKGFQKKNSLSAFKVNFGSKSYFLSGVRLFFSIGKGFD